MLSIFNALSKKYSGRICSVNCLSERESKVCILMCWTEHVKVWRGHLKRNVHQLQQHWMFQLAHEIDEANSSFLESYRQQNNNNNNKRQTIIQLYCTCSADKWPLHVVLPNDLVTIEPLLHFTLLKKFSFLDQRLFSFRQEINNWNYSFVRVCESATVKVANYQQYGTK